MSSTSDELESEKSAEISQFEADLIILLIEETISELEIAKKIAKTASRDLELPEREKILQTYETIKRLMSCLQQEFTTDPENAYKVLQAFINENHQKDEEWTEGNATFRDSLNQFKSLKLNALHEQAANEQQLQGKTLQLGVLKDQFEDETWEQDVKYAYVATWQETQVQQNEERNKMEEQLLEKEIAQGDDNLENEYRVHDELENFYSMKLGEYIQQLVDWVDKYEKDKTDYDEKIAKLSKEHNALCENMKNAKELYASRQAEMKCYEDLKEQRRQEQIRLAYLNAQVTKIQAWWKGMMVRCKLGPYKVKKTKGKAKQKKK